MTAMATLAIDRTRALRVADGTQRIITWPVSTPLRGRVAVADNDKIWHPGLGAVCTVEIIDCVPIVANCFGSGPTSVWIDDDEGDNTERLGISRYDGSDRPDPLGTYEEYRTFESCADQYELDDFTPGRWAILVRDPRPLKKEATP